MAIKDVVVYLDNDKECGYRVKIAASICQFFEAHLTGLYVTRTLNVYPYPYNYLPADSFATLEAKAKEKCDDTQAVFAVETDVEGLNSEFRNCDGHLIKNIGIQSRYADLLIVPRSDINEGDYNPEFLVSDTILAAACPVLLLPEGQSSFSQPPKHALVAWNGSRECARALSAALPLLARVEQLDVVSVSSNNESAEDISLHLNRHGFNSTVHVIDGGSLDAGRKLLDQATQLDVDLMVMGAYGHSRIREQILGGATKYVLDHTQLPILFSH